MKKLLSCLLVLTLTLTLVAYGGALAEEKIELRITWWGNSLRHELTEQAIALFMEQNPGVTIESEYTSWSRYWDRMATQVAANDVPDVLAMDLQYLRQYVEKGQLLDLTPYMNDGLDLTNVNPNFYTGGMLDGKLYGVNLGNNSLVQLFDAEVLAELGIEPLAPGYTWDEYVDFLRALRAVLPEDKYPATMPPCFGFSALLQHRLRQLDLPMYTEDGKALGFDDASVVEWAFSYVKLLQDEGLTLPIDLRLETNTSFETHPIVYGMSVIDEAQSNGIVTITNAANKGFGTNILPMAEDQVRNGQYIKPSHFFSVSANTKHPDMAVKFIDFITNSVECNEVLMAERGVPISSVVREALATQINDWTRSSWDYIDLAAEYASQIDPPDPAGHSEVVALLTTLEQEVLFDQITPEEAASRFMKEAEEIIAKY